MLEFLPWICHVYCSGGFFLELFLVIFVIGPDCGGSTHFVRSNGGHGLEMMETVVDYMFRNLFPFQICNIKSPIITINHLVVEIDSLSNAHSGFFKKQAFLPCCLAQWFGLAWFWAPSVVDLAH